MKARASGLLFTSEACVQYLRTVFELTVRKFDFDASVFLQGLWRHAISNREELAKAGGSHAVLWHILAREVAHDRHRAGG